MANWKKPCGLPRSPEGNLSGPIKIGEVVLYMELNVFYGLSIPFLGTSLGAACVFFMKKNLGLSVQRALTGFAAGVMVAASVWSLLISSRIRNSSRN